MGTPQAGIFAFGTKAHAYLEFDREPGADARALVTAVASLDALRQSTAGTNLVVGFAADLWREVAPEETPLSASPFERIDGLDGLVFPATQHDAWVWLAGADHDGVFDAARTVIKALRGIAKVANHIDGFTYHDSRDLSGFIDGMANRPVDRAADVAIVAEGLPGAGSSIALVQHWVHDLDALHALPLADQEAVFGRTKADGIEFDDDEMPPNAHIARVEIDDDNGDELEIFRRSVPVGNAVDHGLEFVAFSSDRSVFQRLLESMAGLTDSTRDRLTDFSTPVSGAFYVVPANEALSQFATSVD